MKPDAAPRKSPPPILPRRSLWLWISGLALAGWLVILAWLAWRG